MDVEELRDELHEAHDGPADVEAVERALDKYRRSDTVDVPATIDCPVCPATIKKDEFREHLEDEHQ